MMDTTFVHAVSFKYVPAAWDLALSIIKYSPRGVRGTNWTLNIPYKHVAMPL